MSGDVGPTLLESFTEQQLRALWGSEFDTLSPAPSSEPTNDSEPMSDNEPDKDMFHVGASRYEHQGYAICDSRPRHTCSPPTPPRLLALAPVARAHDGCRRRVHEHYYGVILIQLPFFITNAM
ncbi:hypothetical protein C8J57DRAFT_1253452 [Mycena rebaudengoi]|nr:hypothetical protein C8J57DRAFT_1253452 [Mycena rebaudengoi]